MSMPINALLTTIWAAGWGCMTWFLWGTLLNACSYNNWEDDNGVMICWYYKAVYNFTSLAL